MIFFNKIKMLALFFSLVSLHARASDKVIGAQDLTNDQNQPQELSCVADKKAKKKCRDYAEENVLGRGHRGNVSVASPFKGTPKSLPLSEGKRKAQTSIEFSPAKRRRIDFDHVLNEHMIDAVIKRSDEDLSKEARKTREVRNILKGKNKDYWRIPELENSSESGEVKELKMQRVPGARLDDAVKQSYFTQREFLELMRNVFLWVSSVHEEGYCHEDISFGNIMVLPHDTQYFSVIDWELSGKENIDERTISGHEDFTAPEAGKAGTFIRREADVYSLGMVIHKFFGETIYEQINKLIENMTKSKPASRITLSRALEDLDEILKDFSDEVFQFGSFQAREMIQGLPVNAITAGYVGI